MTPKVLITDPVHQLLIDGLLQAGYEVDYEPETNYSKVLEVIGNYNGIIINSKIKADVQLMDAGARLKFIGRLGSGLDVIDMPYADKKGIAYFNSPEGNCRAVAEHALGMLLSMLNNINSASAEVKEHVWQREKNRGEELNELTIGIIGYGHTGKAFAQLLSGFGVTVLAYDKYLSGYSEGHVKESSLAEIYEQADVLSLHVQLTNETCYMVNGDFLKSFRKAIYLINTSRGKVLKTADLVPALDAGILRGVMLDVLENEKPETYNIDEKAMYDQLMGRPQVMVTPHIAGWTHASKRKIAEVVLRNILKIGS